MGVSASLLLVAAVSLGVAALSRHYGLSAPLVLVAVGLAVGWIPGLPEVTLDPELVLFVILPPLLYSAAQESSYQEIRANRRAIALLAVGLPLFSAALVGLVAWARIPHLPWAAALVLGAVVAPPDAVSAQAIGRRVGLPRRLMTLLGGESLLNDATALTALRVSVAAAIGVTATVWSGLWTFLLAAIGGLAIGLLIGYLTSWARGWLTDPTMEVAIGIMVPFGTYFVAEELHTSGVIAVVITGLVRGHRSVRAGYATRLADEAVRTSIDTILEAFVFLLIGLQLPTLVRGLQGQSWTLITVDALIVLATVIVARFLWVFPTAYLPRLLSAKIRRAEPAPKPSWVFVVGWAGMRGVVSLAAAFTIPLTTQSGAPFPARAEILFLTFIVVVGTLLIQGTTLPWMIRRLDVVGDDAAAERLSYAAAADRAARAAYALLDHIEAEMAPDDIRREQIVMQRTWVTTQRNTAWEELGRATETTGESPTASGNRIRTEILHVQRKVFIEERQADRIDDEVLRMALRRLDFAEGFTDREQH